MGIGFNNFSIINFLTPIETKDIYDDGYHHNSEGNKIVYEIIEKEISNVKNY